MRCASAICPKGMSVHDTDTARAVRTLGGTLRIGGDSVYEVLDKEEEEESEVDGGSNE